MSLSVTQTIQHQLIGSLMNSELERIWREGVVAKFKAISQYFPGGGGEKATKNLILDSWSLG